MTKLEDWIDYMEGEAAEMTSERLKLLLAHSKNDRLIYANLRRLRKIILHADSAESIEPILENDRLMFDLHDRIMSAVKADRAKSMAQEAMHSRLRSKMKLISSESR